MQRPSDFKDNRHYFTSSIFNSYSQVFFSDHRGFAVLLLVISFFDPFAGAAGFLSVLTTSIVAFLMNYHKPTIAKGLYGFNSLLTGLGLGVYYQFNPHLVFIIILASVFTLFVSVNLQGILGKYHLPFLSLPFIIAIWIFFLATNNFHALGINERGIYTLNEFYALGGMPLIRIYESFSSLDLPEVPKTFFISLSAIFFQYNIWAGMVIAIGLLLFSRIAFVLAWLGFLVAYLFYFIIDADITTIDYSYIGFNYILTSIAIGGFFLVPSSRSFLSVIILIPLVAVITTGLSALFIPFRLPVYSLPFSIISLMFLYAIKFRVKSSPQLAEVVFQFNSPEKNLYTYQNKRTRFKYHHLKPVKFPFFGVWNVSQAHEGEYTHKDLWKHAWDFVILDRNRKQFQHEGLVCENYYCYDKPVTAPADGTVVTIVEDVEDNEIGEVDLKNNWGNTVVIRHDDHIFSKMSHLKKGSVAVKEGQTVRFGQVIGKCGNSGRSPYPHLHFQMQEYPHIGSATLNYPVSHYLKYNENNETAFCEWDKPLKNERVSNVNVNTLMKNAFQFVPGQILTFCVKDHDQKSEKIIRWEIQVNAFNESYIYCPQSGSYAYFENHDSLFYFTQYYGKRKGELYRFFMAAYKIQKGFYKDLMVKDQYPLHQVFPLRYLWIQDFLSPFFIRARSVFQITYRSFEDSYDESQVLLESSAQNQVFGFLFGKTQFNLKITEKGISSFSIKNKKENITLEQCPNNLP